ncbi:MAG: hypothetical protein WC538_22205 [Thermoanaerobaculia bacterium]|jgi:hypothetical protein
MPVPNEEPKKKTFAEDPAEWLKAKDAEILGGASPAGTDAPPPATDAPPATAEGAAPAEPVAEEIPEEESDGAGGRLQYAKLKHGFLRKLGDEGKIESAFRETERKMHDSNVARKEAETRAAALQAEVERLRASPPAAVQQPAPSGPPPVPTSDDPRWAQIEDLWWTDNAAAMRLLFSVTVEEADRRSVERDEVKQSRERSRSAVEAGESAVEYIAENFPGYSRKVIEAVIKDALPQIKQIVDERGLQEWTNPEVYISAFREATGQTEGEGAAPPPRRRSGAPGGGAPAAPRVNAPQTGSPISETMRSDRIKLANELRAGGLNINIDRFVQRAGKK